MERMSHYAVMRDAPTKLSEGASVGDMGIMKYAVITDATTGL